MGPAEARAACARSRGAPAGERRAREGHRKWGRCGPARFGCGSKRRGGRAGAPRDSRALARAVPRGALVAVQPPPFAAAPRGRGKGAVVAAVLLQRGLSRPCTVDVNEHDYVRSLVRRCHCAVSVRPDCTRKGTHACAALLHDRDRYCTARRASGAHCARFTHGRCLHPPIHLNSRERARQSAMTLSVICCTQSLT